LDGFPADTVDHAHALETLAELKKVQGKFQESNKLCLECIDIFDKLFGKQDSQTITARINLGINSIYFPTKLILYYFICSKTRF
jgi:hypothetical protein